MDVVLCRLCYQSSQNFWCFFSRIFRAIFDCHVLNRRGHAPPFVDYSKINCFYKWSHPFMDLFMRRPNWGWRPSSRIYAPPAPTVRCLHHGAFHFFAHLQYSTDCSNKSSELNFVQKSQWTHMLISSRSGTRELKRLISFKYYIV